MQLSSHWQFSCSNADLYAKSLNFSRESVNLNCSIITSLLKHHVAQAGDIWELDAASELPVCDPTTLSVGKASYQLYGRRYPKPSLTLGVLETQACDFHWFIYLVDSYSNNACQGCITQIWFYKIMLLLSCLLGLVEEVRYWKVLHGSLAGLQGCTVVTMQKPRTSFQPV